jgi:hypothetical protein
MLPLSAEPALSAIVALFPHEPNPHPRCPFERLTMVNRRSVPLALPAALAASPFAAQAQSRKDTIVLAMALEPRPAWTRPAAPQPRSPRSRSTTSTKR